ncbi:MAG: XamI family restriction endonuclease [Chloroflexota bacterium]
MTGSQSSQPRRWSSAELSQQRRRAIDGFVAWWKEKGNAAYQRHFGTALEQVQTLFASSDDLLAFGSRHLIGTSRIGREVNSYKRLNHEVGNKAASWTRAFGQGVIPAAVLDGVFKLENLERAQTSGIAIFWERDLQPLTDFVLAAR